MVEQLAGVDMEGHVVPVQNRLLTCPDCGGRLSSDKNAFTTRDGNIFRERACMYCHSVFYTKQEPERVTRQMKEEGWEEGR